MRGGTSSDTVNAGAKIADAIIARRKLALARHAKAVAAHAKRTKSKTRVAHADAKAMPGAAQSIGHLVAMGDSWFDYPGEFPANDDIIKLLEEAGYSIESCAHAGDPVEAMAYNPGGQLYKLAQSFEKIAQQGAAPKAVLLSGGGDDIAGTEFGMLLNNAASSIGGWNEEVLGGVIDQRIATAYRTLLDAITALSRHYVGVPLPILIHGYDYAVPDGRGFLGGWWILPGPWLQPGFNEKQFSDLSNTTAMVQALIDRFNDMLQALVKAYPHVRYLDLRGTLSNVLAKDAYKSWWANELHPAPNGFRAVSAKFLEMLDTL
jgi:hypothetical protein